MKIVLANPRGFCAGVNMAIVSLEKALALFGAPLYVYHEIVHNRPIVERFRGRGVVFVDDISEVPNGGDIDAVIHVTGSQPNTTATGAAFPCCQYFCARMRPCFCGLIQRLIRSRRWIIAR
jgi:4-hydroxy-3-methylbut-2-enyl diphosphate reductase IspH